MTATKRQPGANRAQHLLLAVLALTALLAGTSRSEASLEKLRKQMTNFSVDLKNWLDARGEKGIEPMSSFQNLPGLATYPATGLAKMLTDELERAKVPIRTAAALGINGKLYRSPKEGPVDGIKELTIVLEVVGSKGPVHHDDLKVTDKETLDMLLGRDPVTINKSGEFFNGPYRAEILVNGQPRPAKLRDGIPFVVLKPEDEYTIRLINQSGQEAAVWVGIDGLSMFAFDADKNSYGPNGERLDYLVLVPGEGKGMVDVEGWYFHKGKNGSRKFLVTEYPQSAAYLKQLSISKIGMITVQFWETWPKGSGPKGVGTGFGTAFTQEWTQVERDVGQLKATLTIRYDKQ